MNNAFAQNPADDFLDELLGPETPEPQPRPERPGLEYTPPGQTPAQPTEPEEDISWLEVAGALRPDRLIASFAGSSAEVFIGAPQIPQILWGLSKEMMTPAGTKSFVTPKMSAQAAEIGYTLSVRDEDINVETHPIMYAIMQDYKARFGSLKGFKRAFRDNPFDILIEAMPALSKAAKAGKLGKLSKTLQYANPEELIGTLSEASGALRNKRRGYNPEMKSTYGRDGQGRRMQTTKRVGEVAEHVLGKDQGTSQGDVPAMVLSDSRDVQIREGIQMHDQGDLGRRTNERFDESQAGIEDYQRRKVDTSQVSEGYSPFDPIEAGDQVVSNFGDTQLGKTKAATALFDELEQTPFNPNDPLDPRSVLDKQPASPALSTHPNDAARAALVRDLLPGLDDILSGIDDANKANIPAGYIPFFENTIKEMRRLKGTDSKLLTNKDIAKSTEILNDVIKAISDGGWTIRDFDRMRTNYRQHMDIAMQNGEISRTGSGTVANKIYAAMTEDLYNMLEYSAQSDPDIPDDLADKVRAAKDSWKDIMELENTNVGKWLLKRQNSPRAVLDGILKGDVINNQIDMNTLKELIGEQGITDLRPALLSRIFDNAMRQGEWSPTGLKNELAKVNGANKNKMRILFGDTMAKDLAELSEFSARFARKSRVATGSPTGFINRIKGTGEIGSVIRRVGSATGAAYFSGFDPATSAALGIAWTALNMMGDAAYTAYMNSPNGRRSMLEGGIEIGGVVVTAEHFEKARKFRQKHKENAKAAVRTGVHLQQSERRGRGAGSAMDALREFRYSPLTPVQ